MLNRLFCFQLWAIRGMRMVRLMSAVSDTGRRLICSRRKNSLASLSTSSRYSASSTGSTGSPDSELRMIYDIVQSTTFVLLVMINLKSKKHQGTKLIVPSRDIT